MKRPCFQCVRQELNQFSQHLRLAQSQKSKTMYRLIVLLSIINSILCMTCDHSEDKGCLNVFDKEPKGLPKCYCTKLCPQALSSVQKNCTSGQLLPDICGTCLQCAKTRGQECGGLRNVKGQHFATSAML